jgi:Uma2 family endonuclease
MASASVSRYTPAEYLALERDADCKHEYYDGYITAMAGGSPEHNRIAGNFFRKLGNQFEDRECEAFISDVRLLVSSTGLYTYPDVMAVCGEPLFEKLEGVKSLLNPTMIVEVLSRTTEAYDRGDKFVKYRRIESLKDYVLVSQDTIWVERYTRRGDEWVLSDFNGLGDTVELHSIGCAISLPEIYAKVRFGPGLQVH